MYGGDYIFSLWRTPVYLEKRRNPMNFLTVLFFLFVLAMFATLVGSVIAFIVSFWTPAYAWWPRYQPWLRRGWIGSLLSGFALCLIAVAILAYVYMPSPAAGNSSSPSQPQSGSPADKCEWLRQNFPQTTEGIQAYGAKLAKVQPERVRTHVYRCTDSTTVFDGMIILGPNEGYSGEFTIAVPENGAVDSYADATYTGHHELLGAATDTVRAYSGTVTAVTATYWPWLDEDPPVDSSSTLPEGCMTTAALADLYGWNIYDGNVDKYGGLVVELTEAGRLPEEWIAVGENGKKIDEYDSSRGMKAGFWTVYPSYSCRKALGYSQ